MEFTGLIQNQNGSYVLKDEPNFYVENFDALFFSENSKKLNRPKFVSNETTNISFDAKPEDLARKVATHMTNEYAKDLRDEVKKSINKRLFTQFSPNKTERVIENISQHKYAKLANASYENFKGKNVSHYLSNERHTYTDIKDFVMDTELSTKDNLVLHNPLTGESVISFRGTQVAKDWITNARIANPFGNGAQRSKRYKVAESLTEDVISKYGRSNLKVVGHSQGGGISSHIGQKYDLEGHHFDPAMSFKQLRQNWDNTYKSNKTLQTIYRPFGDGVSINTYGLPKSENINIKNVGHIAGYDKKLIDFHDMEHFHPKPEKVIGETVEVIRSSHLSSLLKAAGTTTNVVGTGVSLGFDLKHDLTHGGVFEKESNVAIDVAKSVAEFYAADAVFAATVALAPETMGISLVGFGASVAAVSAMDYIADELKSSDIVEDGISEINDFVENVGEDIADVEDTISKNTKHYYHEAKNFFGF